MDSAQPDPQDLATQTSQQFRLNDGAPTTEDYVEAAQRCHRIVMVYGDPGAAVTVSWTDATGDVHQEEGLIAGRQTDCVGPVASMTMTAQGGTALVMRFTCSCDD